MQHEITIKRNVVLFNRFRHGDQTMARTTQFHNFAPIVPDAREICFFMGRLKEI